MSDPMTNSEVEDVLSSIRRLVSDEKRSDPVAPEEEKPAASRLVLTPSLRVLEADAPVVDPSGADSTTEDAFVFVDPFSADAPAEEIAESSPAEENSDSGNPENDPLLLADRFDESDDVIDEADEVNDEADPEDTPEGDVALDFADIAHETQAEAEAEDCVEEASEGDADADVPETLGAKIAALETLIAGRTDEWEPDQAGTDEYAGTEPPAMAWEDTEEKEEAAAGERTGGYDDLELEGAAPYVEGGATKSEAETPTTSPEVDVLDEDALRELVSDIVREELQGALGERITRNVRKLVRRELHRALTAQDFE